MSLQHPSCQSESCSQEFCSRMWMIRNAQFNTKGNAPPVYGQWLPPIYQQRNDVEDTIGNKKEVLKVKAAHKIFAPAGGWQEVPRLTPRATHQKLDVGDDLSRTKSKSLMIELDAFNIPLVLHGAFPKTIRKCITAASNWTTVNWEYKPIYQTSNCVFHQNSMLCQIYIKCSEIYSCKKTNGSNLTTHFLVFSFLILYSCYRDFVARFWCFRNCLWRCNWPS